MTTTTTARLIARALLAAAHFVHKERDNGEDFWCLNDDDTRPDWVQALCYAAHGGMGPDDHRYEMIYGALSRISEASDTDDLDDMGHEFADAEPSPYNAARAAWLASHLDRGGYVDQAVEEVGIDHRNFAIYDVLAQGWYMEARDVFSLVLAELQRVDEEDA